MQNEHMQTHVAKFRVTGGNASPKGTGSITLTLSPEATSYAIELPDKTALELDEIDSLDRVELKRGWRDWKEYLKAGAVAGVSLFGGGLIIEFIFESIDGVQLAAEAMVALESALELGDDEAISSALLSLAEAQQDINDALGGTEGVLIALAGFAAITGPAAYGGVVPLAQENPHGDHAEKLAVS